ncbi:MAG: UTP--glucose-1-phosphate uridylyltransferase [Candidatus Kerfeldbacteria bacterium CG08_land_8_20_14_0_20_42_7]|uniref:UTP--glucose-1-phosphate uridylyltransferase n=1 Tax=Candidatus Kerfeldbacteria bacterium CG08_land_8_20_14_0_20_42_7 TaxID=2014245 RepID=A0A2H0YRR7_9BACT|nr:MAG: UTP--glucose-1-phosphate uridylyltransferase [Candidatus Kerfeldbacteria bacterium CG08_land_8_20_14_0_20_42_7]
MTKVTKAVIPVAGFGTRFLPATKAQPKEMLTLVDKPVIQYIVEEAVASGIEDIVFITGQNKRAIEDHFDRNFELEYRLRQKNKTKILEEVMRISDIARFVYIRQKTPLGLGHAVLTAKDVIGDNPFVVLSGDDLIDADVPATKQLIDVFNRYQDSVIGALDVPKKLVDQYGIVKPRGQMVENVVEIEDIIEKPKIEDAPSTIGVTGRWLLTPDIFACLEKTKPGAGGEIQLTDGMRLLLKQRSMYACKLQGEYYDCGNKLEFLKATVNFGKKHEEVGKSFSEYLKKKA